jgi:spermidine/putrescine transport system ATP-binding protein
MTVAENISFGLEMLNKPKQEIKETVNKMLSLVRMEELKDRRIDELSGGQKQRVALARALAPKPKVLLLDESLSALDYKLRKEMQIELKRLQHATGITFIFVTHDQEEALTMSDRIAVINEGKLLQVGTPHEIYDKPHDHFVASFVGDTNFLEMSSASKSNNNEEIIVLNFNNDQTLKVPCHKDLVLSKGISIAIRPEKVSLVKDADSALLSGEIVDVSFFGTDTHYSIELDSSPGEDSQNFHVRMQNASNQSKQYDAGERVGVVFNTEDIQVIGN